MQAEEPEVPSGTSFLAGAAAGLAVEGILYPVDTLKTRLQSPNGFKASGGSASLYKGIGVALAGSVPCSALFFGTCEFMQHRLRECIGRDHATAVEIVSAATAETVSSAVKVPVELMKQRLQTGMGAQAKPSGLWVGFGATLSRDLPFSVIQYPLYRALKRAAGDTEDCPLEPWKAALCGTAASSFAAICTTPFDVAQTRLMLAGPVARSAENAGMSCGEIRASVPRTTIQALQHIHRISGIKGLFAGVVPRASYMAIGGFIYLGTFEEARRRLRHSGKQSAAGGHVATKPSVALLSGGFAATISTTLLHPFNTMHTRALYGEYRWSRPAASCLGSMHAPRREFRLLFNGLRVAVVPAVPSAASFFIVYEAIKDSIGPNPHSHDGGVTHLCLAAVVAEGSSCLIRMPADKLKMRLQLRKDMRISAAFRSVWVQGGATAFYRGLGPTLAFDLPFAMLRMPTFELMQHRLRLCLQNAGHQDSSLHMTEVLPGFLAGGFAGAFAGIVTTPLDAVRTRLVLDTSVGLPRHGKMEDRPSFMTTLRALYMQQGAIGLFRGVTPRTIWLGSCGALHLGTYSYCCSALGHIDAGSIAVRAHKHILACFEGHDY